MGFSRVPVRQTIMTSKATTGVGSTVTINDYQNDLLQIATAGNANLTIKIQGSLAAPTSPPDFSAAATATNPWAYLACYDLNDPSTIIVGSTGISFTGTDAVKNLVINTDGIVHLNASVTARVAGSVSVTSVSYNNQ